LNNFKMRTIGDMYVESRIPDGPGVRITNDFLSRLVKGFAKRTSQYMYAIEGVPFVQRERQLHSLLIPALSEITAMFMIEFPTKRNWSSVSPREYNDSHGWIDYWCRYRDITFFIELKHGYISSRTGLVNGSLQDSWQEAIKQLNVIENGVDSEKEVSSGVFRIALEIVPIYETVNKGKPKTLGDMDNLFKIQNDCFKELEPPPNWSALWKLHNNLAGPHQFLNKKECYPGILFLARVSEISRK